MNEEKFVKFKEEVEKIKNIEVLSYWTIINEEITKRIKNEKR